MSKRAYTAVLVALIMSGCSSTAVPPLALDHPANPNAPEAPLPQSLKPEENHQERVDHATPHATGGQPSEGLHTSHEAGSDKAPAPAAYTCPMHPEVVSNQPGRCPKCGMKLVKRPAATAQDGSNP